MKYLLQLAACTLLTATTLHAQFHMPQLTHKEKSNREDLSWLAPFALPAPSGRENDLVRDPRFKPFVREHFTAPQTFWNDNQPLPETILEFLAVPNQVLLDENRFLSADGCVQHFCPARGLLFADLGTPHPLIVFAAIDWTREGKTTGQSGAEYTLWLFSNKPLRAGDSEVDTESSTRISPALVRTLARWTGQPSSGSTTLQNITHTILVDPDGTPHPVSPGTLGITAVQTGNPGPGNHQPASEAKK